jgi:hypothetical protein
MARIIGLLFSGASVPPCWRCCCNLGSHLGSTTLINALDQVNTALAVIH